MTYTVVFETANLLVRDVIEGIAKFGEFAAGLDCGTLDAETAPAIGSTLSAMPADAAQRAAMRQALQSEIDSLNVKYSASLSASDSIAAASAKLFAAGAAKGEVTYLKTLYDSINAL